MNRIDRISAILIHLQSWNIVKAQDIADSFAISLRTVYRDIKTLEQAGISLIDEAGNIHARYNQQKTERLVEPLGVFYSDNCWHLIAFCCMRNDYRDFRFDRISSMILTNTDFSREHQTLKEYLDCASILQPEALKEEVRRLIGVVSERAGLEQGTKIKD